MNQNRQNFMLRSTYEILKRKVEEIKKKLEEDIPRELRQTYDTGGYWHDNPQWDYTLLDQKRLSEKLSTILAVLDNVVFIEDLSIDYNKITIGTQVEVRDVDTGKVEIYRIVGIADVIYNPQGNEKRFISWNSPLARSLLGKSVNEEVVISLPSGTKRLTILAIKPL